MATVKSIFSWMWAMGGCSVKISIIVQPAVAGVAAWSTATRSAFFATHKIAKKISHICFDLFGIFAGLEPLDGHVELFGRGAWRHQVLHFLHHMRHVPWVIL